MANRVYQHLQHSGPGGAWTLTVRVPAVIATPGAGREALRAALGPVLAASATRLTQEARQAYGRFPPMAAAFVPRVATGPVWRAGVGSDDPILPWKEFSTRPHWPPFKPGSALARWKERHPEAPPAKVVARLISQRGTKGLYVMDKLLTAEAPRLVQAVQRAIAQVLA